MPGVAMSGPCRLFTTMVQAASEYTLYVIVPVAVAALVPVSVAVSVTAVSAGTQIVVAVWPPPESEVDSEVGAARR